MSSLERFEFVFPSFYEADCYLKKDMLTCIQKMKNVGYAEFDQIYRDNERFRSGTWHTDGEALTKFALASSSTPTEFAQVTIEYDRSLKRFPPFFLTSPSKAMSGLFGDNWVDSYIDDALETNSFGIYVKEAAIVQALPYVVAIGAIRHTLHRSAERHASQPRIRAIYRDLFIGY